MASGIVLVLFSGLLFANSQRETIARKNKEEKEAEYFRERDLISFLRYSLKQIEEYYVINKNQARYTYWAALFVSLLGFLGISGSIYSWQNNIDSLQAFVPIIGILSGIILEFIAFSILNIYKATLQQLNSYFVQLVRLQELLLAIELSDQLSTKESKDSYKKFVVKTLLNSYTKPIALASPELITQYSNKKEIEESNVPENGSNSSEHEDKSPR